MKEEPLAQTNRQSLGAHRFVCLLRREHGRRATNCTRSDRQRLRRSEALASTACHTTIDGSPKVVDGTKNLVAAVVMRESPTRGLTATMGVPGRRARAVQAGELVLIDPDCQVKKLGLKPGRDVHFRLFVDDADRMLLSIDCWVYEIDLVRGVSVQLAFSALVITSFAPLATGLAVVVYPPRPNIVVYGKSDVRPWTPVSTTPTPKLESIADVADARVLILNLEDRDNVLPFRTVVVEVKDHRLVPLAGFRNRLKDVQLIGDRVIAQRTEGTGYLELLGLAAVLADPTPRAPVDTLIDAAVPAGLEGVKDDAEFVDKEAENARWGGNEEEEEALATVRA